MTTLDSFRPRLRTRERVPALVLFAGVIDFTSGLVDGVGGRRSAVVDAGGVDGAGAGVGIEVTFAGGTFVAATGTAPDEAAGGADWVSVSLPKTSITRRSGSRRVSAETRPIVPMSKTTRTVELSYCPTRMCC